MNREPPKGFDLDELREAAAAAYRLGGEEAAARVIRYFRLPVPCPRCCGSADDPEWRTSERLSPTLYKPPESAGRNPDLTPGGTNWGVPAVCTQCNGQGAVERRDNPACRWKLWGVPVRLAYSGKVA